MGVFVFSPQDLEKIYQILNESDYCRDGYLDTLDKQEIISTLQSQREFNLMRPALEGLMEMAADADHDGKITVWEAMDYFRQYRG